MPYYIFFNGGDRTVLTVWKALLGMFKRYGHCTVKANGEEDLYVKLFPYCQLKKVKYVEETTGSFYANRKITGLKPTFKRVPEYYLEGKLKKIPISKLVEKDVGGCENKYSVNIKNKKYPGLYWHHAPSLEISKNDYFWLKEVYRTAKRCNKHMNLYFDAKTKLLMFTPRFGEHLGQYWPKTSFKKINFYELDELKSLFS